MSRRLRALVTEIEALGLEEQIADLLELYVRDARQADRDYEAFHWGEESERAGIVMVPTPPPVVWQLGPVVKVIYEASKGGELVHWDHDFEDERPTLAYSKKGKPGGQLWIVGGDYKVNARGIVG